MQELPENTTVSHAEVEGKRLWMVQLGKTKTYGETEEQAVNNFLKIYPKDCGGNSGELSQS